MKPDNLPVKGSILLVDSDPLLRRRMSELIMREGHRVTETTAGEEVYQVLEGHVFSAIFNEVDLKDERGFEILAYIKEHTPHTPVIAMTGQATMDLAAKARQQGAFDLLEKPFSDGRLLFSLGHALEKAALHNAYDYLRHEQPFIYNVSGILAHSPGMKTVMEQVLRVAQTDATVLLTGETGTGKSLIAGAIHFNSRRKSGNMITVNCAALAENLLEDELFGHEKGAFTGAHKARTGRFQQAHGGTLFLDEVGDMSSTLQAKVLRAIEEKVVERVGGNRSIEVDVRMMAATNVDLEEAVVHGRFREDLYYRLKVATIEIPPLRERREDILPLAERFLLKLAAESKQNPRKFTDKAKQALLEHDWPGNIRELRNIIERALIFTGKVEIDAGDIPLGRGRAAKAEAARVDTLNLIELEKHAILTALEQSDWVQRRAAKLLGVTPRGLHYKLNKLRITHPKLAARRRGS